VLLDNAADAALEPMSTGILDVLYGRTPPAPRRAIGDELLAALERGGPEAAVARYRELKTSQPDAYDFGEAQLNVLGYQLLATKKVDAAVAILRLNADAFPESSNVYDSLGEALMAAGKRDEAIRSYARSLELDPNNTNAIDQLLKLKK
jgi:tetratricopeptide (TPR) repeat protein